MRLPIIALAAILAACAAPGPTVQEQLDANYAAQVNACKDLADTFHAQIKRGATTEQLRELWRSSMPYGAKPGHAAASTLSYGDMVISAVWRWRELPPGRFGPAMNSECLEIVYLTS